MRSRGDRKVAVVKVGARARERERLKGLRRGAHERDDAAVAGFVHDRTVFDRDRVHAVNRLDHAAAADGDAKRLHRSGA